MGSLTREDTVGHEQQVKTCTNGDIKILTENEDQFERTLKIIEENETEYHKYQLKAKKAFYGIHPQTEICEIKRPS